MLWGIRCALDWFDDRVRVVAPVANAMRADFSWPKRVPHYEELYRSLAPSSGLAALRGVGQFEAARSRHFAASGAGTSDHANRQRQFPTTVPGVFMRAPGIARQ